MPVPSVRPDVLFKYIIPPGGGGSARIARCETGWVTVSQRGH